MQAVKAMFRANPVSNFSKKQRPNIRDSRARSLRYFEYIRQTKYDVEAEIKNRKAYYLKCALNNAILGGADEETLRGVLALLQE